MIIIIQKTGTVAIGLIIMDAIMNIGVVIEEQIILYHHIVGI